MQEKKEEKTIKNLPKSYKVISDNIYQKTIFANKDIIVIMLGRIGPSLCWEIIPRQDDINDDKKGDMLILKLLKVARWIYLMITKIGKVINGYLQILPSEEFSNTLCIKLTLLASVTMRQVQRMFSLNACSKFSACKYRFGEAENCCDYCPTDYKAYSNFRSWQRKQMREAEEIVKKEKKTTKENC